MASEEDLGAFFKRLQEKRSIELTEEDRGYIQRGLDDLERSLGFTLANLDDESFTVGNIQDHLYDMDLDLRRIGEAINQKYPLIGSQCHAQAEEVSK